MNYKDVSICGMSLFFAIVYSVLPALSEDIVQKSRNLDYGVLETSNDVKRHSDVPRKNNTDLFPISSADKLWRIGNDEFDKEKWDANVGSSRLMMLADLVRTKKLVGSTRKDVEQLLGISPPFNISDSEQALSGKDLHLLGRESHLYSLLGAGCGNAVQFYLEVFYDDSTVVAFRLASIKLFTI